MMGIASRHSYLERAAYRSLGLNTVLRSLQDDRKYHILDLGQPLGVNVEFWSQFRCRLYIEDFYRSYRAKAASESEVSTDAIFAELLRFSEETSFDIILAWDLFNYLNPEESEMLIRQLSRWCRPGTLLFALISSLPLIPAEPIIFRILDSERMIYETRTHETQPCPRYYPRDIAKFMGRFEVSSSFLLRHGIQEYVFAYRA
jgi:predicted TPR repeat methyltransferase